MIKKIHLSTLLYLLIFGLLINPVSYGFSLNYIIEESESTSFVGEFTTIWDTTRLGTSADNEITIPINPAYTYNYTVDWGDGSTDTGVTAGITHAYATSGAYTVKISGDFPAIYFNNSGDRRKIIEILEWGVIEWQTMENAFFGCENLNFDAIDTPDLSRVTNLTNMFRGCSSFNGIINDWDVSNITDLTGTFLGAQSFNRPLDRWNVSNVTSLKGTFSSAILFNEPLDNWDVGNVTDMEGLFAGASAFNQNINNWDVSQVTIMKDLFARANTYNQPLNLWNINSVINMSGMFSTTSFNQDITNWIVSNVTDMSIMFANTPFNQDISVWDVSNVTNMSLMFRGATVFNQPIGNWDVSNVTNMRQMFLGGSSSFTLFNQNIESWDVSNVTNMQEMFKQSEFNQPLNNWNVSNVTDMSGMFAGGFSRETTFNQPLDMWDTSSVTSMATMFSSSVFDQPITTFNMTMVTNIAQMFFRNREFNQSINNWNIANVVDLQAVFLQATSFNQPLDLWDTSSVVRMDNLFGGATSFNQNIADWSISNVTNMTDVFSNSGIDQTNYDQILIGWGGQAVQSDINFGAATLTYCDGRIARQDLIDNFNWTFIGDTINCPFATCTTFASPTDGDTNVPANFNLVWNASPDATGYNVTVTVDRGGTIISVLDNEDVGNNVAVDFVDDFMPGDIVTALVVPYNGDGPAVGCTSITFTVVPNWTNDTNAFIFTIDTSLAQDVDDRRLFAIQRNRDFTYDYSVDWGDGQFNNNVNADITHNYLVEGVYTISIIGTYPAHILGNSFRDSAQKLTSIEQWGTNKWQSMEDAFRNTRDFAINDPMPPDLSEVTNMQSMFESSSFNQNINNWNVSNVTNMARAFIGMSNYNQPLNDWDVSNVTTMSDMFLSTRNFNQPLDQWDVGNVTSMRRMFDGFNQNMAFNQNINTWDVSNVTDMETMFRKNINFDQSLGDWNVSNVINMMGMFMDAIAFNQNINSWTPENVTNMAFMFRNATAFNQPLDNWDLNSLESMSFMFQNATSFNQDINAWDVNSVENMSGVFNMATAFNQPLDNWDVTNVTNMTSMFESATAFNQDINTWDVNSLVNMTSIFKNATSFNQPINNWDVSAVANMTSSFEGAIVFDQDISAWDVSSVTLMSSTFKDASVFNSLMNDWDVGSVTRFDNMFQNAVMFNQALSNWDTGEAQNMQEMFSGATSFNQNINPWNVSFVMTMEEMFKDAITYNQTMDSWNVASVATMKGMFQSATSFNETINSWNVRNVTTMEFMFDGATAFDQILNNWRVSGVENMDYMFRNASSYNQEMNRWNIGSVSMQSIFENATSFDQFLGDWNISSVNNMLDMLDNTALTRENYDSTLIAWSEQALTSGINLGAETLLYCDSIEERQSMIDTYGWIFTGDIRDCPIPVCTQLTSPEDGDVDVPINTNLVWESVLYATEYVLTITLQPSGTITNVTVATESYEFAANELVGSTSVTVLIEPRNDEGTATGCVAETFSLSTNPATVPDCTNLTDPITGATDVLIDTDISWDAIADADGYFLTIGTSTGGSDILNNEDVGNVTTYDLTNDLPEDTEIFVTLIPYNEEGNAAGCSEESFTTELIAVAPSCTTISEPLNGATNVAIGTNLSWNSVDGATGYLVSVGTTQGGIEIANSIDVENVTIYDFPTDLSENRTFYVTIIPYNDVGDAAGCAEESFTTETIATIPSCTTLSIPLNGATDIPVNTDLSWSSISDATGYRLTVGTSSGGTDIINNQDVSNVTTFDLPTDLPENTEIFVNITPYNAVGDATGCTEESFTTETITTPTGRPFITTWQTTTTNESITIPTEGTGYDYTVDWGDGITTTGETGDATHTYVTPDIYTVSITGNFPRIFFDTNGNPTPTDNSAKILTIEQWGSNPWTSMRRAFTGCINLTGNFSDTPDLSNVTDTTGMFATCRLFNSNINNWDMSNVTEMAFMFQNNASFNQPLNNWDVSKVTNMFILFQGAVIFNQPLDNWDVSNVVNLSSAFSFARAFDQNIGSWNVEQVADATNMFQGVTLSTTNYDALLIGWNAQNLQPNVVFSGGNSQYCEGEVARTNMISSDGWVITDDGIAGPTVDDLADQIQVDSYTLPTINGTQLTGNEAYFTETNGGGTRYEVGDTINFADFPSYPITIYIYDGAGSCTSEQNFLLTITTSSVVPNCTSLSAPTNGTTNVVVGTDITWNSVSDATGYRLTVGTTSGGTDIINNQDVNNVTTFDLPNDLPENTEIFVTVIPYNAVGDATGCLEESFTTETITTIPSCTTLSIPLDDATDISVGTDISWNSISDATGYRLTVGTSSGGTDIINNQDVNNVTTFDLPTDLPENTEIFVTVIPYNAVGDATGCVEESFTTETLATIPNCTTLSIPLDGATDISVGTDVTWNFISDATGYRLTIGTSSGGTDIINNQDVNNVTIFDLPTDLPENTEIFVTIIPYNAVGEAISCIEERFTTENPIIVIDDDTKYGFSPDGDGINEFWEIDGIENYPENTVSIYNRWGDMVFEISGYDNASRVFRGDANRLTNLGGGQLPEGTYFFNINIPQNNSLKKLKGFLVLKR